LYPRGNLAARSASHTARSSIWMATAAALLPRDGVSPCSVLTPSGSALRVSSGMAIAKGSRDKDQGILTILGRSGTRRCCCGWPGGRCSARPTAGSCCCRPTSLPVEHDKCPSAERSWYSYSRHRCTNQCRAHPRPIPSFHPPGRIAPKDSHPARSFPRARTVSWHFRRSSPAWSSALRCPMDTADSPRLLPLRTPTRPRWAVSRVADRLVPPDSVDSRVDRITAAA